MGEPLVILMALYYYITMLIYIELKWDGPTRMKLSVRLK